jgi:hypothetical protein
VTCTALLGNTAPVLDLTRMHAVGTGCSISTSSDRQHRRASQLANATQYPGEKSQYRVPDRSPASGRKHHAHTGFILTVKFHEFQSVWGLGSLKFKAIELLATWNSVIDCFGLSLGPSTFGSSATLVLLDDYGQGELYVTGRFCIHRTRTALHCGVIHDILARDPAPSYICIVALC